MACWPDFLWQVDMHQKWILSCKLGWARTCFWLSRYQGVQGWVCLYWGTLHNLRCQFYWGVTSHGIETMPERLGQDTGSRYSARAFRRGFACNLHRKGLSTLGIMHLGGWSDLSMVLRYTRSITFEDCLEHYKRVTIIDSRRMSGCGFLGLVLLM